MIAVYKKEIKSYFCSMMAYLFLGLFIAAVGIYFTYYCLGFGVTDFSAYVLNSITILYLIVVPILTMRLMAEEKKQKTDQLLLTSPLRVSDIVIGKYLAVITLFVLAMGIAAVYGLSMQFFGKISIMSLVSGLIGYFLLGAALTAVGLFISTISENQVTAAVLSFTVILGMYLLPSLSSMAPGRARYTILVCALAIFLISYLLYEETKSYKTALVSMGVLFVVLIVAWTAWPTVFDDGIANMLNWFSVLDRVEDFFRGKLNLSSIFYFFSFIVVFLFLSIQQIWKRRWK